MARQSWEHWHDIEMEDAPIITFRIECGLESTVAMIEKARFTGHSNEQIAAVIGRVGIDPKPYAGGVEQGAQPITHTPHDPLEFGV